LSFLEFLSSRFEFLDFLRLGALTSRTPGRSDHAAQSNFEILLAGSRNLKGFGDSAGRHAKMHFARVTPGLLLGRSLKIRL
jgi:hypothetical protein